MRSVVVVSAILSSLILAGCNDSSPVSSAAPPADAGVQGMIRSEKGQPASAPTPAVVVPMMAYAYGLRLEVSSQQSRLLLARHQEACEAAGAALCQVLSANSSTDGDSHAQGQLTLKAAPGWLKTFRARIAQDADKAGGKVAGSTTEAEDLTKAMVDTDAAIRAQTALQARLERLLVERPGTLADALEIERELARVRGTLDATRGEMEAMKSRVAMSRLTIDYGSRGVAAPDGVAKPLSRAFEGFLGNVMWVLAGLVTLLSFVLPLAIVAADGPGGLTAAASPVDGGPRPWS